MLIKLKIAILIVFIHIAYSQDTLKLKNGIDLYNPAYNVSLNLELAKMPFAFEGYLVIKIDPKSNLDEINGLYETEIYWVGSLRDVDNEDGKILYSSTFSTVIATQNLLYDGGEINELTSLAKYYEAFNKANNDVVKVFLYNHNDVVTTDQIIGNTNIFEFPLKPYIYFIIFRCKFDAAILKFIYSEKNSCEILFPISYLKKMDCINESEVQKIGLKKANLIIKGN